MTRSEPASDPVVIAAFDVDGTLTRHDCVVPFLRRVAGTAPLLAGLARRGIRLVLAVLGRRRDAIKQVATEAALERRPVAVVQRHAEEFMQQVVASGLREDTTSRLDWHRSQGHRVVLVSASYEVYLEHLGRHLGVDAVIATRLETRGECYTGRLEGVNCRGPEKLRRLQEWIAGNETVPSSVTLWAYGDSTGDRELLAAADHPVWARGPIDPVPSPSAITAGPDAAG